MLILHRIRVALIVIGAAGVVWGIHNPWYLSVATGQTIGFPSRTWPVTVMVVGLIFLSVNPRPGYGVGAATTAVGFLLLGYWAVTGGRDLERWQSIQLDLGEGLIAALWCALLIGISGILALVERKVWANERMLTMGERFTRWIERQAAAQEQTSQQFASGPEVEDDGGTAVHDEPPTDDEPKPRWRV